MMHKYFIRALYLYTKVITRVHPCFYGVRVAQLIGFCVVFSC